VTVNVVCLFFVCCNMVVVSVHVLLLPARQLVGKIVFEITYNVFIGTLNPTATYLLLLCMLVIQTCIGDCYV